MKKLSRGARKHIRLEKARIRRVVFDIQEQKKQIAALYEPKVHIRVEPKAKPDKKAKPAETSSKSKKQVKKPAKNPPAGSAKKAQKVSKKTKK